MATRFFVADGGNQRVLQFDTIPCRNRSRLPPRCWDKSTSLRACKIKETPHLPTPPWRFPTRLAAKGNLLAVSDHTNNRTMLFDLPITTDQSASKQIGQPDFVTATNCHTTDR